jgi:hypothetical protein
MHNVARAAADLEAGPEFAVLLRRLSELPDREAEQVVSGLLPVDAPATLAEALRVVAVVADPCPGDDRGMTGAGWRIRPGNPDDREMLASFACADPAIRWQAEVEQFIQLQLSRPHPSYRRVVTPHKER